MQEGRSRAAVDAAGSAGLCLLRLLRLLCLLLALLLDSPLNCGQIMIADSTLMSFLALFIQEENLRAGLLLEQAAHCLLLQSPPHVRKFAFHLVLAGLRYDMCAQKGLAQRAYK